MTDDEHLRNDAALVCGRDVVKHFLRREVRVIVPREPLGRHGFDREGVHRLRVSARRLRSILGAIGPALPRRPWRHLEHELEWLGATLGQLRDLDVVGELFDAQETRDPSVRQTVAAALEDRRGQRRRDVVRALDSSRYRDLARRLEELARHPDLGARGDVSASTLLTPALWDAACRYVAYVGDPYQRRDDVDVHRVRIASKKCRYNFEVATHFLGEPARSVAESLKAIQGILGQFHDRVVAVSFLDTLDFSSEVDIELRHALREQIETLRPQWIPHFEIAREGIIDVFAHRESVDVTSRT